MWTVTRAGTVREQVSPVQRAPHVPEVAFCSAHSETGNRLTAPPLPSFLSVIERRQNCPLQTSIKTYTASKKPALTTESLWHMLALLNSLVSSISPFIHKSNRNVKAVIQEKKNVFKVEEHK